MKLGEVRSEKSRLLQYQEKWRPEKRNSWANVSNVIPVQPYQKKGKKKRKKRKITGSHAPGNWKEQGQRYKTTKLRIWKKLK